MKNQQGQQETVIHYKLYKKKKLWMVAALAGVVGGLAMTTNQVSADTNQSTDQQTTDNATASLSQSNNQQQLQQSQYRLRSPQPQNQQPAMPSPASQDGPKQVSDEESGMSLSVNHAKYNPASGTGQTVTFSVGGIAGQQTIQAGDTVKITIPAGIYKFGTIQSIPAQYGHTSGAVQVGNNYVITDTFTKVPAQTFQQSIALLPINYRDEMDLTYGIDINQWFAKEKVITAEESDGRKISISFDQVITPSIRPKMSRLSPAVDTHGGPALHVGQDYEWQVNVDEVSGLYGNEDRPMEDRTMHTSRFNGSINKKGTITIPVPESFVLNVDQTKARNNNAHITVSQAGKGQPVIITDNTVDQAWDEDKPAYIIVGKFDMAQPETNTTVHFGTATNPVKVEQELNYNLDPLSGTTMWSDTILGRKDSSGHPQDEEPTEEQIDGHVQGYQTNDQLQLDHDMTRELNHISFQNNSAQDLQNVDVTIDVPDGLNVYSFNIPRIGSLDRFAYTVTFVDGTSTTGTATADMQTKIFTNPIAQIKFTLPNWTVGAGTGAVTSYFGTCQGGLILYGTVAKSYRHQNKDVQVGDQVTTHLTIKVGDLSKNAQDTQTLVKNEVVKYAHMEVHQGKYGPGYTDAGNIRVQYTAGNDQTAVYFIVPENATVSSSMSHQRGVTIFQKNGRTIVKVTKEGSDTGYYTLYLDNDKPALASTRLIKAFIYPGDDQVKLESDSSHAEFFKVSEADLPFVEGHRGAYLVSKDPDDAVVANPYWRISPTTETGTISAAEGNQDSQPEIQGHSDDHGATAMTFHSEIVNTSMNTLTNVINIVNLPDNDFKFELTGPARAVDPAGNVVNNVQIKYGLAPINIHLAPGQKNDVTAFVTADQIADWSQVRSVAIIVPSLANGGIIDLEMPGQDPTLPEDAGKQAALSSVTTAKELNNPFIIEAGKTNSALIVVTGKSTVNARFHYKDQNGQDQYIALDDLSKTYRDNVDTMPRTDFPRNINGFTVGDLDKIPAGYHLVAGEPTIINSSHGPYENNYANNAAEFGKQVKYYYDGDIVQYELVKDGQPTPPSKPDDHPDTPTPPKKPDDHPDTPTPPEKPDEHPDTPTPPKKPDEPDIPTPPKKPDEPTPPTEPVKPAQPGNPAPKSQPVKQQVRKTNIPNQPVVQKQNAAPQLPQTGNDKQTGLIGLGIAMIMGIFGLAGKGSKRHS